MASLRDRLRKSATGRKTDVVQLLWLVLITRNVRQFTAWNFIRMMEGMVLNLEVEYLDFPVEQVGRIEMYLNFLNMGIRHNILLTVSEPAHPTEELYFFTGSSSDKIERKLGLCTHLDEFDTHHVCRIANCAYFDLTSDFQVVNVRGTSKLVLVK